MAEDYNFGERKTTLFSIPASLRFSLIWLIFFSILGIVLQYLNKKVFLFPENILEFFTKNYLIWLNSFGNFTNPVVYESTNTFLTALLNQWYYFFLTGGLLAFIWGIISWIIHIEISFSRKHKSQKAWEAQQKEKLETQKTENILEKYKPSPEPIKTKLEEWLEEGLFLLSEGKTAEAAAIYESIKQEYDPDKDQDKIFFNRILRFYEQVYKRIK